MYSKLNLHNDPALTLIRSYENGKLTIGGTQFASSVIVTSKSCAVWPLSSIDQLTADHFACVFELGFTPELVLLGTGPKLIFPAPEHGRRLIDAQIGLEIMDTAAACRTYNVLVDDGRRVAACLIV